MLNISKKLRGNTKLKKDNAKRPIYEGNELGLVYEDGYELSGNTIEFSEKHEQKKAEYGFSSAFCDDGTPFDHGPSGGSISPFTEVNAENQGIISEVPRKPHFIPNS